MRYFQRHNGMFGGERGEQAYTYAIEDNNKFCQLLNENGTVERKAIVVCNLAFALQAVADGSWKEVPCPENHRPKFSFVPGALLPNGAVIKDCAYIHSLGYWVVVAFWATNSLPWVRWCCDEKGNCNWGRYNYTYKEAYQLFVAKIVESSPA